MNDRTRDPSMSVSAPNASDGTIFAPPKTDPGRNGTSTAVTPSATVRPLERVLALLKDVTGPKGGQWTARCPAHEDHTPSLSIREGDDGRVLLHCHAVCPTEKIVADIGLTMRDLFVQNGNGLGGGTRGRVKAIHDYQDEGGRLLSQVLRYDPRGFSQRRPDGRGNWIWDVKGVRRVLYRLDDLAEVDPGRTVFVVEGEKDADRLWDLNVPATTCSIGAGHWDGVDDEVLRGRPTVILPDNDEAGADHADDVAQRLTGKAASVKILLLPGLPAGGGDVSDWLDAGGTADELWRLAEAAPEAMPQGTGSPAVPPPESHSTHSIDNVEVSDAMCTTGETLCDVGEGEGDAAPGSAAGGGQDAASEGGDIPAALEPLIRAHLPTSAEGFDLALFGLARAVKFDTRTHGQAEALIRRLVDHWHHLAKAYAGGRGTAEVWHDFQSKLKRSKHPKGVDLAEMATRRAEHALSPPCVERYTDAPDVARLVGICAELQRGAGARQWSLSCRQASKLLWGTPRRYKRANMLLLMLQHKDHRVLFCRKPVSGWPVNKNANKYRFIAQLDQVF